MEQKTVGDEMLETQKRIADNAEGLSVSIEREILGNEEIRELQKQELRDSIANRQFLKDLDIQRTEAHNKREDERLQLYREDMVMRRVHTELSKRQIELLEREVQMLERISSSMQTIARTR